MPAFETYKNLQEEIESRKKIDSWNNKKRICARCKKNRLDTFAEREHNCCIVCGLEMLLEN